MGQRHRIEERRQTSVEQDGIRLCAGSGSHHQTKGVKVTDRLRRTWGHASDSVGRNRNKEGLLRKRRMEQAVLRHVGQQVGVFCPERGAVQLQIRQLIALIGNEMKEDGVLIIDRHAVQTDWYAALGGEGAMRPTSIVNDISLAGEGH